MRKNVKLLVAILLVASMLVTCVACGSSSEKAPETKTEGAKAEEVTTEAPEVATTEAKESMSEEDSKIIEKFWDTGGRIRYFTTNTHAIQFEKVYLGKEEKEVFEAEKFEDGESKWLDSSSKKEAFDEIILFFYKCDEAVKNLGKGEDVIELPNQDKEDFVKHEWKEGEAVLIKDSKYIYDCGFNVYGEYTFSKSDGSNGEPIYSYTISEESLSDVNKFAEYCNELEKKNK